MRPVPGRASPEGTLAHRQSAEDVDPECLADELNVGQLGRQQ